MQLRYCLCLLSTAALSVAKGADPVGERDVTDVSNEKAEGIPDIASAASYGHDHKHHSHDYKQDDYKHYDHHEPIPYYFSYGVKDKYYYNDFGQQEYGDGKGGVKGSYYVYLPDGRTQHVKYHADHHKGYQAEVTYSGEYGKGHDHKQGHHDDHQYGYKDDKYGHHDRHGHSYGHNGQDHHYSHHGHKHDHKYVHHGQKYGQNDHKNGQHDQKYGHHDHKYGHHDNKHHEYHKRDQTAAQQAEVGRKVQEPMEKRQPSNKSPVGTVGQNQGFVPMYVSASGPNANQEHSERAVQQVAPATTGTNKSEQKSSEGNRNYEQLSGFTFGG